MANSVKFSHIGLGHKMPSGLTPGTIYFDANTKTIKLATSATGAETYGATPDLSKYATTGSVAALDERVGDAEEKLEVLGGTAGVTGSVAYQIAQIIANAPEALDSLQEIAAWITTHETSVISMNSTIQANSAAITELQNAGHVTAGDVQTIVSTSTQLE